MASFNGIDYVLFPLTVFEPTQDGFIKHKCHLSSMINFIENIFNTCILFSHIHIQRNQCFTHDFSSSFYEWNLDASPLCLNFDL